MIYPWLLHVQGRTQDNGYGARAPNCFLKFSSFNTIKFIKCFHSKKNHNAKDHCAPN